MVLITKQWIDAELTKHLKQNPVSFERFKESFVIAKVRAEPTTYIRESPNESVNMKTKLYGKDVCYTFDVSDDSIGIVNFTACEKIL